MIKGSHQTASAKLKISIANKGKHRSEAFKKRDSEYRIGRPNYHKGHPMSIRQKRCRKKAWKGKKNPNWKGGITSINILIRNSANYKLWRKACFQRDNFTCQKYGISGGRLVVHHINNFADFPELRFAIDNGITLSEKAHREFHKRYGKHNNTREQLNEFLKNGQN